MIIQADVFAGEVFARALGYVLVNLWIPVVLVIGMIVGLAFGSMGLAFSRDASDDSSKVIRVGFILLVFSVVPSVLSFFLIVPAPENRDDPFLQGLLQISYYGALISVFVIGIGLGTGRGAKRR